MKKVEQLKIELIEAQKRRWLLEEQLKNLAYCINVLQKEVIYRTI